MKLVYKAVRKDGKVVQGLIEAKNPSEAAAYLRKQQLFPVDVSPPKDKSLLNLLPFHKGVRFNDLVFFTRQLSSMLTSGLTLMQSLGILKNQIQNPALQVVVDEVIVSVQEGSSFSTAISKYPDVFSPIYVSLVKAGEQSGLLDNVLKRLADNLEKQQKLRATIKGAMMYPIIVVIVMIIVVGILMVVVVPSLSNLYKEMGLTLPLPTLIVVGISSVLVNFWPALLVLGFVGSYYSKKWYGTEGGKLMFDSWVLKVPIFGKLVTQSAMTDFTRTFGLLVGTGTLVVESLNRSAEVVGNIVYKRAVVDIAKRVEKGVSVGDALASSNLFPPIVIEMARIGEQTGKLDESLTKVSEYFEREVENSVKALTTALEPMIMIVLAIVVGFLVISIITPIYSLVTSL